MSSSEPNTADEAKHSRISVIEWGSKPGAKLRGGSQAPDGRRCRARRVRLSSWRSPLQGAARAICRLCGKARRTGSARNQGRRLGAAQVGASGRTNVGQTTSAHAGWHRRKSLGCPCVRRVMLAYRSTPGGGWTPAESRRARTPPVSGVPISRERLSGRLPAAPRNCRGFRGGRRGPANGRDPHTGSLDRPC